MTDGGKPDNPSRKRRRKRHKPQSRSESANSPPPQLPLPHPKRRKIEGPSTSKNQLGFLQKVRFVVSPIPSPFKIFAIRDSETARTSPRTICLPRLLGRINTSNPHILFSLVFLDVGYIILLFSLKLNPINNTVYTFSQLIVLARIVSYRWCLYMQALLFLASFCYPLVDSDISSLFTLYRP